MALGWLWVALPRLSRLDVGCSTFNVRCFGPRTVPVRSGSEWAWVLDLLAPSCPRGRCEPGRFAVVRLRGRLHGGVEVPVRPKYHRPVTEGYCVVATRGGELPEVNCQSVTKQHRR